MWVCNIAFIYNLHKDTYMGVKYSIYCQFTYITCDIIFIVNLYTHTYMGVGGEGEGEGPGVQF